MKIRDRVIAALAGFAICFAVGASLSVVGGLESRIWVPAGLVTSTMIAMFALRSGSRNERSQRRTTRTRQKGSV
jgi:sensor c-di-GMP phosphodiesterase-like protein